MHKCFYVIIILRINSQEASLQWPPLIDEEICFPEAMWLALKAPFTEKMNGK